MSKSKGNFFTFRDLRDQGYSPLAIRYLLLSVPYRKQLNFTFEGLQGAESTIERLQNFRRLVRDAKTEAGSDATVAALVDGALNEFEASIDDDFNTANALAAMHNLVREINTVLSNDGLKADDRTAVLAAIEKFDSVLGIFGEEKEVMLDADIDALIAERQTARQRRNFNRSDEIRDLLAEKGIILEDTKDGVRWKRKC
jgi:cysteinyl-tRNA synthetase